MVENLTKFIIFLLKLSILAIGSLFFIYALFGLYFSLFEFSGRSILPLFISIFGLVGYIGLWYLILDGKGNYNKLTFTLLLFGIASFLLIWVWSGINITELYELFTSKYEYPENVIFLYFLTVCVSFTISLARKITW